MCVCAQRRRHSARQAEVGELDFLVVSVDQQILRLEITMEDAVRVAVRQTGQELKHEFLPRNRGRASGAIDLGACKPRRSKHDTLRSFAGIPLG
jgi:hypothetical protein